MAKAAKTAIKKGVDENAKAYTKVIKPVKNEKTGSYSFKTAIIHKDNVDAFLKDEEEAPKEEVSE